jgi:hypothetical protein
MSTSRRFHDLGNMAATVIRPSGGKAARFDTKRTACFALQKVIGVCGETKSTFMAMSPEKTTPLCRPPRQTRAE